MSFDGVAEADNINARIGALVSGQVWEGSVPDDYVLAKFANGSIKPYIITKFSTPIATKQDRLLGVDEQEQPYIFSGTLAAFAADSSTSRRTLAAALKLLVGWLPNGANSSPIRTLGGYSYTRLKDGSVPSRYEQGAYIECFINQSTT